MHESTITLPDRPTGIATCQRCGRPIKYYLYHDKEQTQPARKPTLCRGACTQIVRSERLRKKVQKWRQRKESEA